MQKEKHLNKYRINTKDNKFSKSSYFLRTEVKKAIQTATNFIKVREHKLDIAKKEINTLTDITRISRKQISQKEQK